MAVWNENIAFAIYPFPGCCGVAVVCNGEFIECADEGYGPWIENFLEFVKYVISEEGRVGVILFSDNPDGPLDRLYNELQPTAPWVKEDFVTFTNPTSGNQVVLKALVRKD